MREHDLWLTVEGHGAGFWDGNYKHGMEIVKSIQGYDSYWSDKLNDHIKREVKNAK